jgi:hypothetical protein
MAYNDPAFRAQFAEFADPTAYPAITISNSYFTATAFINDVNSPCRTLRGNALVVAMNYLTAHLLYLSLTATNAVSPVYNGGGMVTSASIGEISATKLAPPVEDGWQYWLASSPYGQALWALLKLKSVGGTAVNGLPERTGFRKIGGVFL